MNPGFIPLLGLILAGGITLLGWETEGFRVVTTAGAQQLAVERNPVPVPNVELRDQNGERFSIGDYRGKTILVDFIYTRCTSICNLRAQDFLAATPRLDSNRRVNLLSISFDPSHDDRAAIESYAGRFRAIAPAWRIAAPIDKIGLDELLRTFGVVAIPDGYGGFVHNDDLYVVDAGGRLTRILPEESPSQLIAQNEASP